jgi:hypothetical protein
MEESLSIYNEKTKEMAILEGQLVQARDEVHKLQNEKNELKHDNHQALQKKNDLTTQLSQLEISNRHLTHEIELKRQEFYSLEKTHLEIKVRVENIRMEEFEMLKSMKTQQAQLAEVVKQSALIEATKNEALKMQEESLSFLNEKREFYRREMELMEDHHRLATAKLGAEFQAKKLELEKDFEIYKEKKEQALRKELDEVRHMDQETIRKKRKALTSEILDIFKKQDRHQAFTSQEQKVEEAKKDISALFDKYFGRHQRWKLW